MSCQEYHWNTNWCHKSINLVLVIEVSRRSPKPKGNDVHWHNDKNEKQAIDNNALLQNHLAASVEDGQIEVSQEVNLNLELVKEFYY